MAINNYLQILMPLLYGHNHGTNKKYSTSYVNKVLNSMVNINEILLKRRYSMKLCDDGS